MPRRNQTYENKIWISARLVICITFGCFAMYSFWRFVVQVMSFVFYTTICYFFYPSPLQKKQLFLKKTKKTLFIGMKNIKSCYKSMKQFSNSSNLYLGL